MTFAFEKKEAIDKIEHKKKLTRQKFIAAQTSKKQKTILIFVAIGLTSLLTFSLFILRTLRITKRQKDLILKQKFLVEIQKHEIEAQKEIAEEKQKEVMDSIRYAKRIQYALLPSQKILHKNLIRLNK